jgi:hypothetical protein
MKNELNELRLAHTYATGLNRVYMANILLPYDCALSLQGEIEYV